MVTPDESGPALSWCTSVIYRTIRGQHSRAQPERQHVHRWCRHRTGSGRSGCRVRCRVPGLYLRGKRIVCAHWCISEVRGVCVWGSSCTQRNNSSLILLKWNKEKGTLKVWWQTPNHAFKDLNCLLNWLSADDVFHIVCVFAGCCEGSGGGSGEQRHLQRQHRRLRGQRPVRSASLQQRRSVRTDLPDRLRLQMSARIHRSVKPSLKITNIRPCVPCIHYCHKEPLRNLKRQSLYSNNLM